MQRSIHAALAGGLVLAAGLAGPMATRADEAIETVDEFTVVDPGSAGPKSSDALVWNAANNSWIDRAFAVPLPRTVRRGVLQTVIDHRNSVPVDEEPLHNFFGFDGGSLKIGLGLTYGLTDTADIGVYRLNGTAEAFDTYQFTGRYQALNEGEHEVDLTLLAGLSLFTMADREDASGAVYGVLAGRSLLKRLYLSAGALHHMDSSSEVKTAPDDEESSAVLASVHGRLRSNLALVAEAAAPVGGYDAGNAAWSAGIKFNTHRHTFSLVASNTQYMGLDGIAAGSSSEADDVILGFSITREIPVRHD